MQMILLQRWSAPFLCAGCLVLSITQAVPHLVHLVADSSVSVGQPIRNLIFHAEVGTNKPAVSTTIGPGL